MIRRPPRSTLFPDRTLFRSDPARFRYGERTVDELEPFTLGIAEVLLARRAKLLVVACNTATAAALPALQRRMMETTLGIDVIGVGRPEAVQLGTPTRHGGIGLLATPPTARDRKTLGSGKRGDFGGRRF